ncbi:hypothetical protein Tco_0761693, partial [Tanacetum coccineum]
TVDPTKVRVGERQCAEDKPKLLDTTMGRVVPLLPIAPARVESELDASVDSEAAETVVEDVTPVSVVQRLLAGAVQNAEVRGEPIPTLPFVTSSVSAMPEREDEVHSDSAIDFNLRTIGASQRFVISLDFSHHSDANIVEAKVDSFTRPSVLLMTVDTTVTSTVDLATTVTEKFVESSVFGGDSSGGGADHTIGGFSDLTGSDFIVGGAESAEAIRLRTEASNFEVVEKSLRDEVNVLKQQNAALEQESTDLGVKVADLAASVKVREQEVADLDAQTSSAGLQEKVTAYENCMGKLEEFQDEQIRVMNDKFKKLYVNFVEMVFYLEEKFYPYLLTTIAGRRWLLTYSVKLAIVKCLHSPEYMSAFGAAISRAIEKGMQDGLAAGITHGQEGRVLTDIDAFNPSAESDYIYALQELQDMNFSLLAELKSNKDASTKTLMNILRLDEPLAERLGLDGSQPHVDQLLVPIHHSPDRTVIGATSLLFSLDVSCNRVKKIRDNIANHSSALRDVFVPLVEPLSSAALEGTKGTSGTSLETAMALSVTFASTSSIPPIFTNDYDVVHADGQESTSADGQTGGGADVNHFPNIEDAELDIS